MFPQLGATAGSLSKASSLVFRMGTDAHIYDDPDDVNIVPLLDSRFDSDKSQALKRLLALIAQGLDVSHFFPHVVKNVASQSLELKKLVYLYLLHYAEKRPNEALLSINCFQKDLSDTNPLVRAWALRAMAGIRLHVIAPLVLVAVTKCSRDPSVYVRKCAANALPKLYDLHYEENVSALKELVGVLLSDNSPGVIGAAAAAFNYVCPNNLSLIGRSFKRLCETLPDVEEWGQIVLIEILLRYVVAKHGLVRESIMFSSNGSLDSHYEKDSADSCVVSNNDITGGKYMESKLTISLSKCYVEGFNECLSPSMAEDADKFNSAILTSVQNGDVKILLQCTTPLLWSQNSAVVLAAAGVHWIMASKEDVWRIVKPLLFLLRSSQVSKYVVLCNIHVFAKVMPSLFVSHFEDFFICCSDSYQMKAMKLEILSTIATDLSIPFIFQEFQDYIKDLDRRFVADTVAAIGLCAQRLPGVAEICLEGLLALTIQESSTLGSVGGEEAVLTQSVMSMKAIINQSPASHEKVIVRLARILDGIKVPVARAAIIWMIGEYNSLGLLPRIVPKILGYLARCFPSEHLEAKLQILNTAAKVVLCTQGEHLSTFKKLLIYVLELAKYDLNYDIRDRARVISKLMSVHLASECQAEGTMHLSQNSDLHHELAKIILSGNLKSTLQTNNNFRFYLPGSLSHIVFHSAPGYEPLPKPCSLLYDDLQSSEVVPGTSTTSPKRANSDSFGTNDPDSLSGSSNEESGSYYSENSVNSSVDSDETGSASDSGDNGHNPSHLTAQALEDGNTEGPLIHLSDSGENSSMPLSIDLTGLMSKKSLDSWLDEQPGSSEPGSAQQVAEPSSSVRLSLRDCDIIIEPKIHILLDPANGNGLKVGYAFSSEISSISKLLVCVEIFFENCSMEPLTNISVKDEETIETSESRKAALEAQESTGMQQDVPTFVPVEEIATLEPHQAVKRLLQLRFHHHLLPLKLVLFCNGRKYPVKLRPDIGYFVTPLAIASDVFMVKQSQLPGMFEYTRRCNFADHIMDLSEKNHISYCDDKFLLVCKSLASKMLSNANVFLVSIDMPVTSGIDNVTGLCLRFSSEILSSSILCLITITVDGKCSEPLDLTVKVNCEETVFGLNLLNRVVAFLSM